MPRLIPIRLVAACALALALFVSVTAVASAKKVEAELRVVGKGGKVLDEETLKTGPTTIKTSTKATCFGAGTGGSGKPVAIERHDRARPARRGGDDNQSAEPAAGHRPLRLRPRALRGRRLAAPRPSSPGT